MPLRALVTTLPKAGTHFINILLQHIGMEREFQETGPQRALLGKPDADEENAQGAAELVDIAKQMKDGQYLLYHVPYHPALSQGLVAEEIVPVVLIRDPRDFVVSFAHHIQAHPTDNTRPLVEAARDLHDLQRLICEPRSSASGGTTPSVLDNYLAMFDGWVADEHTLVVHFEDLVGPRGGETIRDQLACGVELIERLGLERDMARLSVAFARSYDPQVPMFRQGRARSWLGELNAATAAAIWRDHGELMGRWGYAEGGGLARPAREGADGAEALIEQAFAAMAGEILALKERTRDLKAQLRAAAPSQSGSGAQ